jgi:hypothetical protein
MSLLQQGVGSVNQPQSQQSDLSASTAQNPLGNISPFQVSPTQVPSGSKGTIGNPAGLQNPGTNEKDAWRNQAYLNTVMQQQKMGIGNQFNQQMTALAQPAAGYFNQLMNLGSPYYQQQQRASFTQGVQQQQNAAAQARQQLSASGYGYTPSGTSAATIGEMAQQGAQNQEQMFLQNLFQNEQLQMAGAQGLGQLAALFNPAPLLGYSSPQSTQGQTPAQDIQAIGSLLGAL